MMDRRSEERLRRFLLLMSAGLFVGTPVELWFAEHVEGTIQLIPFVLCGLGFIAAIVALLAPSRGRFVAVRIVMGVIAAGSLFGFYEHVAHNVAFEMEIRPGSTAGDVFWEALSGASPLLAPGILAVAAVLALAALYDHPSLAGRR